jgi:hypothetical protein
MFKKLTTFILSIVLTLSYVGTLKAFTPVVYIQNLPEYTNTDTFKISYSALTSGGVNAIFSVRKDSDGTWRDFGGTISGASGQVQVTGSQIYDNDGLYRFRVVINGGEASAETNTRIDRSGPSGVSNYKKEMVAADFYRISWTTPHDPDFSRVFIYRSDKPEFDANGSTKVYELGGPPDTNESWDNVGLDPNKNYYYAIRALDKAGNASSLVSDNVVTTYITPSPSIGGSVNQLPKEEPTPGEVLGQGDNLQENQGIEAPSQNVVQKVVQFAKDRTKITVGILAGLGIIIYAIYGYLRKRKK